MADFLLELGTEEIPARMIASAEAELARRTAELLARERLADAPEVAPLSTPRRISVIARAVRPQQPDVTEQVTGPSVKVAFKDGAPTPAAHAFAKKVNVEVSALQKIATPKGEYIAANITTKGRSAAAVLADALPREIAALYWAKNMYWREGKPERFVRPVRWIVALLDGEVVPLEFAGIRAGHTSRGHRILSMGEVRIGKPADYSETLSRAFVIASPEARRSRIQQALDKAVTNHETRTTNNGLRSRSDTALLETVVNLTEFPSAILGGFDPEFLSLPEEVLVTVMRDHQKYFAVEDADGRLAPHFLAVLNTDGDPDGLIRHGNERVLRARFNDARFFWHTDQKIPLRQRVELLKSVTFQKDLGSYYDKTIRVQKLASRICAILNPEPLVKKAVRDGIVHKAALLAKTDLTTELVKEFTELQGMVGGLYAKAQGLDPAVGDAIYDQYKPESMDDDVPRTIEGAVLALADKADTIAGMFALGMVPSGSKDPFALRRAANGIVKIVAEHKLALTASTLMFDARAGYGGSNAEPRFNSPDDFASAAYSFFRERLEFYLRDVLGYAYDVVNAVLAAGSDDVRDAVARARAVADVRGSEDFTSISIAFKRMKNILRQAREKKVDIPESATAKPAEAAEQQLSQTLARITPRFRELHENKKYREALAEMAALRAPVDTFFDKVMVMVDDPAVRQSRLGLLNSLVREFSTIADFSEIVTEASGQEPKAKS
jgi:glycyl-tRNA synthetase beta chain